MAKRKVNSTNKVAEELKKYAKFDAKGNIKSFDAASAVADDMSKIVPTPQVIEEEKNVNKKLFKKRSNNKESNPQAELSTLRKAIEKKAKENKKKKKKDMK